MEILSSPEEDEAEARGSTGANTEDLSRDLGPATGSTEPKDSKKISQKSASEKRKSADSQRDKDVRLAKQARIMLAKFGIKDHTGKR